MNVLSRHIPFVQLADFHAAQLTRREQELVRAHLAGCSWCQTELAWLEQVTGLMRFDQGEDASLQLIADAFTLFNARAPATSTRQRPRVQAGLLFDNGGRPCVAGCVDRLATCDNA